MAYLGANSEIGYYSTVGITKYTSKPILSIQGFEEIKEGKTVMAKGGAISGDGLDVYEYVDFNLLYSETAGVPKAFSKIPGWRKFRFRYVGGKLMGDFPSYDGEILSSEITKMRNKVLDYMDDEDEYDEFYDFDGNGALTGADVTFLRIISLNQYDR